ncbi:stage II sporulation protein E [Leptospira ryugenii]|uniref:Stage II sporulation protein E n=1 Tax=Leptospira ryugenii TaxID=1917863 RepID=A0A2P2DYT7_9LEPT|nr:SpoIIE family protein phosphatase [Leptospira ryugenii]GBF49791.1 stage II sporulation protein E [Leptospira ryugenii]
MQRKKAKISLLQRWERYLSPTIFVLLILYQSPIHSETNQNFKVEHWEDAQNTFALKDIQTKAASNTLNRENFFNFGFSKSAHWFRLTELPKNKDILVIQAHNIDQVDFFIPNTRGEYILKRSGSSIPMSERDSQHRAFIVSVGDLPENASIFIKMKSDISLQFGVSFQNFQELFADDYQSQWLYGLFFGFIFLIFLYNLAIAVVVRDINYFYYVGYVFFFAFGQLSLLGFFQYFFVPEHPHLMKVGIPFFFSGSIGLFALFTSNFLKLKKRMPIAFRMTKVFWVASILNMIFALMGQVYFSAQFVTWEVLVFSIFIISIIIIGFRRRIRNFYYFAAAFLILMLACFVYGILKLFPIGSNTFIEEMLFPVASLADITLFSFALADRIQLLRLDKDRALKQLERHEKERQISRDILMQSLPKTIPQIHNLNIQLFIQPMKQVGGDFYEFYSPNKSELGTLLCDVSGHGIPASLISAMGKVAYSTQKENLFSPKRVLEGMNSVLYGNCTPQYLTAAYVYLNTQTSVWRFGRAGHPSLYLQRASGEIIKVHPKGKIIGAFPHLQFEEISYPMESGDRVLILTDGVTEAFNPLEEMFGETRVMDFMIKMRKLPAIEFKKGLVHNLEQYTKKSLKEWEDDITFILLSLE